MSMQALQWENVEKFTDSIYRKSHSLHSQRFYRFGVRKFQQFCEQKKVQVTEQNVYLILDEFVGYLDAQGLKGKTIQDYTNAAKRFLTYSNFEIDDKKF